MTTTGQRPVCAIGRPVRAIGLMSGTSADGIDAVMIEVADPSVRKPPTVLCHAYDPFSPQMRAALSDPAALRLCDLGRLQFELPMLYAETVRKLPAWQSADVVGMHGQTVWHSPPSRGDAVPCTMQLGSSGVLASRLGLPVVGDMRSADVALGGEGAPIMPLPHWFFTSAGSGPSLVVNVGGIANYTYVCDRLEDVRASDLGPGMMITDALSVATTDGRLSYDRDGELSDRGTVDARVVEHVLAHPFFARQAPRSTGREDFGRDYVDALRRKFRGVTPASLIRSSLAATARAIARAADQDVPAIDRIVVTGGGANHPTLLADLRAVAEGVVVEVATDGPLAPAHHEPAGMALIAARTIVGLPSSLPSVTGARQAAVLGHVHAAPTNSAP